MQTKGVAPILATVLIVLIAIALAGTFLLWSSRTLSSATERGTQESQRIASATQESIGIISLACGATPQINVKNAGSSSWNTGDLTVYQNDVLKTATWTPAGAVAANGVTTGTPSGFTLVSGDTIKVVTKQGSQDSSRCP
ncbi:MAG: hypothetical protein HY366_02235 [Candidatus Aenigmarchaeota archaeon]|nr:hypothetical protein [Candidatus Aenigmarchaeota archaeon]